MTVKPDFRNPHYMKVTCLVTSTLLNALLGLSMHYSQSREVLMFISSTAIVMAECVKLIVCLFIVYYEHGNFKAFRKDLYSNVIANPLDIIKISVPALLYTIQNNILYLSAAHLDATIFQVTYQLKILSTAIFAVLMFNRRLLPAQWAALILLTAGMTMVHISCSSQEPAELSTEGLFQNNFVGFATGFWDCIVSGFAAIYFEKILKSSDISIWMRNVQLSLLSLAFELMICLLTEWSRVMNFGWFYSYDCFTVYLIVLQAVGGLVVALVVKYADNILKGFATSLAIIFSWLASVYLFDFRITILFTLGAILVVRSIFMYNQAAEDEKLPVKYKTHETV